MILSLKHATLGNLQYYATSLNFYFSVDPPKITQHPESCSVSTGADTVFRVEAIGDDLQFQWQKDGIDVESNGSRLRCNRTKNASTLHIQYTKKRDIGHYKCIVRNPIEKSGKPSDEAHLSVCKFYESCMEF